jgi:hypothetical protein
MKRLVPIFALAAACQTTPLYPGEKQALARLIEVIETIDISPAHLRDRNNLARLARDRGHGVPAPHPKPASQPPGIAAASPPAAALPSAKPNVVSRPQNSVPANVVSRPQRSAPANVVSKPQRSAPELRPEPAVAEPVAPAKPAVARAPAPQPTRPAAPVAEAALPNAPKPDAESLDLGGPADETDEAPAEIDDPDTRSEAVPTARDQGRGLIRRVREERRGSGDTPAFAPADGTNYNTSFDENSLFDEDARPQQQRTPELTRKLLGDAKGELAECYVNERLFNANASGAVVVTIEVPKVLPNTIIIEQTSFSKQFDDCVANALKFISFPADPSGESYRLRVPFRFRPE